MVDGVLQRAVVDAMTVSALNLVVAVLCEPVDLPRGRKGRLAGCGMRWFFALAAFVTDASTRKIVGYQSPADYEAAPSPPPHTPRASQPRGLATN